MKIFRPRKSILEKKWYHFLAPRYWPMWCVFGLLRLSIYLPYRTLVWLGKGIGYIAMLVIKKRRRIAEINLRLCFPNLSEKERQRLLKANYASVGLGLFETALAWWAPDKKIRKLLIPQGEENLYAAKQKNHGVLLFTYHFTSIELGIRFLSYFTPVRVMYRPQNNQLFEWMLQRGRRKYVVEGIMRYDVKGMLRNLRNNHVICYTPDQDYGRESSVFAPFFGVPAASVTGTTRFAKHSQAAVVPLYYYRDNNLGKYVGRVLPALENFPSSNEIEDATRINHIIETAIREHPEQYMWQHRRFKTAPPDKKSPYL